MAAKVTAKRPAAKRAAPRKAAAPRPALPAAPAGREPEVQGLEVNADGHQVLRIGADVEDVPEVRVPLFELDGVEYTVLAEPDARIGLETLHIVAQHGDTEVAQALSADFLLTEMLGEEAYAAFRRSKKFTPEQREWVIGMVRALAFGALEDPKN